MCSSPYSTGVPQLKPPTTFEEQIGILKERGLFIENESIALDVLSKVNYYRFTAYLLPFKDRYNNCFKKETSFNKIYRIYEFDRKFRALTMSTIEPIEILLRTKVAYFHGHKYGPEGYMLSGNFNNPDRHKKFINEFKETVQKNRKALFVKHHIKNYGNRFPVWVATEIFSFGMLSKFYANMKPEDRKYISKDIFNTGPEHLKSWLVCLSDLRNRCAHYMRLYFHKLVVLPKLPSGPYEKCSQRVFDVLYIMKYLYLNHTEWVNSFVRALEVLVTEEYSEDINLWYIGFPVNWLALLEKEP